MKNIINSILRFFEAILPGLDIGTEASNNSFECNSDRGGVGTTTLSKKHIQFMLKS